MDDCLFCKIVNGEIPCGKVYEDDMVLAFNDINPAAPSHVLIIPKKHFPNFVSADDEYILAIKKAVKIITGQLGLDEKGYRLVFNTGDDGGQTVHHLHCHILGGRFMEWPPG